MAKDIVLAIDDSSEALTQICEAAGRAGINLEGGCCFFCEGQGVFHALVEDIEGFKRVIKEAGFKIQEERDVLLIDIEDRPGALGEVLRELIESGLKVDLLYLATRTRVAIGTNDHAKATATLLGI